MKRSILLLLLLLPGLWTGCGDARPKPAPGTGSNGTQQTEPEPASTATSPQVRAPHGYPPLLGIEPLTADWRIDDLLRLEVPLIQQRAAVISYATGQTPVLLGSGSNLVYWKLEPEPLEALIGLRPGMSFDCISGTLAFQSPLQHFELWHDTVCGEYFFCAVFPMPNDDVAEEPMTWVAVPVKPDAELVPVEESLINQEVAPPPKSFVGFFELAQDLITSALAPPPEPGSSGEAEEEGAAAPSPAPAAPPPMSSVHFGRFLPGGATGALVLGAVPAPPMGFRRVVALLDAEGNEIWRAGHERLERWALHLVQVLFALDVDGDGQDEVAVRVKSLTGAEQVQVWSLVAGNVLVMSEGTWWGCELGVPSLPWKAPPGEEEM